MPFDAAASGMACIVGPVTGCPAPLLNPTTTPRDRVLRGLVERGHGLEAISACLGTDRERVSEWVARLGLATPHDRPMRQSKSSEAWAAEDYYRFIECWTAGWRAASIGQQFGRSAGAVWSKARWLGLPRRDRR